MDGEYPDFIQSCGWGEVDGICGVNCRHSFSPFYPGVSTRRWTDGELGKYAEKTYTFTGADGEPKTVGAYEASQIQRGLEREIRKGRKIVAAKTGAGLDAAKAKADLKASRARLNRFLGDTGLRRQLVRERVADAGRGGSGASGASWGPQGGGAGPAGDAPDDEIKLLTSSFGSVKMDYRGMLGELEDDKYPDGTYDLGTMAPSSYTDGYQVTFSQVGDDYTDDEFAALVDEFRGVSSDGKVSAGKFGGSPEVSFNVSDRQTAIDLAKKHNQVSIFDWAEHSTDPDSDSVFISTGGTGKRR
jgi:hypothetical protein